MSEEEQSEREASAFEGMRIIVYEYYRAPTTIFNEALLVFTTLFFLYSFAVHFNLYPHQDWISFACSVLLAATITLSSYVDS